MAQCQFIKPDGSQCQAEAVSNSSFCFSHDPNSKEAKILAVTKGGLNRRFYQEYGDPIKLEKATDIKDLLAHVINGVWTGKIPANQPANTIGFLSRCWLDAHEISNLEQRIEKIEEKMEKAGHRYR